MTTQLSAGTIATAFVLVLSNAAVAQNFPTKPITMVVPFAAGGPTDIVARVIGERFTDSLGQAPPARPARRAWRGRRRTATPCSWGR